MKQKLLIIGYGNMGKCFVEQLKNDFEITIISPKYQNINDISDVYDYIVFAIKPQIINEVMTNFPRKIWDNGTIFISMLAKVKIEYFQRILGSSIKFARIMPNLAIQVKSGIISVLTVNCSRSDLLFLEKLGTIVYLQHEDEFDIYTALFGSGTGFVLYFLEQFEQIAIENDIPDARDLILKLFSGTCKFAKFNKNKPFSYLKQDVMSKGGTTEAGMLKLIECSKHIRSAVESAKIKNSSNE